jgi:hypothetical protein
MMRLTCSFFCVAIFFVFSGALFVSQDFFTLSRSSLSSCNVVTLSPVSWLARTARVSDMKPNSNLSGTQIREIIYLPNLFELYEDETSAAMFDDDHFCSLLVDRGYTVHVVFPHQPKYCSDALAEIISARTRQIPGSSICLIGHEISVPRVLNYLTDVSVVVTFVYLCLCFSCTLLCTINNIPFAPLRLLFRCHHPALILARRY